MRAKNNFFFMKLLKQAFLTLLLLPKHWPKMFTWEHVRRENSTIWNIYCNQKYNYHLYLLFSTPLIFVLEYLERLLVVVSVPQPSLRLCLDAVMYVCSLVSDLVLLFSLLFLTRLVVRYRNLWIKPWISSFVCMAECASEWFQINLFS